MEVATLIAAIVAAAIAVYDQLEKRRYIEFLRRVHTEAAEVCERMRGQYGAATFPVKVEAGEIDLAFRALAEEIMTVRPDGVWGARPVRFQGG